VWIRSKNNIKEALDAYLKALSLGGSRPLPELFKTAGLEFDFSEKIIAPLIEGIEKELNL